MLKLSNILELDAFDGAQILAGRKGLSNEVSFVTIMDIPSIVDYVHEGEMLLASSLLEQVANKESLEQLHDKKVSALVTKPAFAGALTPDMLDLCDRLQLPVISAKPDVPWSDIVSPITQRIARVQYETIHKTQQFHTSLMKAMVKGSSFEQLCKAAFDSAHLSVAITDRNIEQLGGGGDIDWTRVLTNFSLTNAYFHEALGLNADDEPIAGYSYSNIYLRSLDGQVFIFPIQQDRTTLGYVFVVVSARIEQLSTLESMQVDQLALVAGLYIIRQMEFNNAVRRYNNLLLDRILHNTSIDDAERAVIEASIGHRFQDEYCVALVETPPNIHTDYTLRLAVSRLFEQIRSDTVDFADVLCFERGSYLVFFIPSNDEYLDRTVFNLHTRCEIALARSVRMGISEPTHNEFLRAFNQALQTLRHIEPNSSRQYNFYADLGILRFFMDNNGRLDSSFLEETRSRYLAPVEEYDAVHNTQLKETLVRYLANNCSTVRTQKELYIHKNTLHARINRIEELLECKLSDAEDRFNIQLAVKIDQQNQ